MNNKPSILNDNIKFVSSQVNTNNTYYEVQNASINQQFSTSIINDLYNYEMYLMSLTVASSEFSIANMYRYINFDKTDKYFTTTNKNFNVNRMNMTITLMGINDDTFTIDDTITPAKYFNLTERQIVYGINEGSTSKKFQGLCSYVTFFSENNDATYPNPNIYSDDPADVITTKNYGSSYFDIHSIGHFIDIINRTLHDMFQFLTTMPADELVPFFKFDPVTQLYSLVVTNSVFNGSDSLVNFNTISIYVNDFLVKLIDGFRTNSLAESSFISPLGPMMLFPSNDGMDNLIMIPVVTPNAVSMGNFTSYIYNISGDTSYVYILPAEYSTINNLFDKTGIQIISNTDPLKSCSATYTPTNSNVTSNQLTYSSVIKEIDISYSNINSGNVNNVILQYENTTMVNPVYFSHTDKNLKLNGVNLELYVVDNQRNVVPLKISNNGFFTVKLLFKNRQTGEEKLLDLVGGKLRK